MVTAGRRVIITGGSGGIGRAIAAAFVASGDTVVIMGRSVARLEAAKATLGEGPGSVFTVAGDITDPAATAASIDDAISRLGGLDVLVSSAGIAPLSPLLGGPEADEAWDAALATNLTGPWRTVRAALPHFQEGGRIITIGAMTGRIAAAHFGAFCASKHALIGMTRSLALDLAPRRITVNAVAPGWVDSALADETFEAMAAHSGALAGVIRGSAVAGSPLGRLVATEEVAQLVLFLANGAAAGITAQVYGVDTGQGRIG